MDQTPYEQIPAKPTMYNGRLYRSRLEARVAAYFELREWEFEYEPFDLKGWSPDFLIKSGMFNLEPGISNPVQTLVEVKPQNDMFDIRKYIGIDFDKYELCLLTPEKMIFISKIDIDCHEIGDSELWKEAANKVMFLKPEYNG